MNITDIANDTRAAALELYDIARLEAGQTVVIGCSTSEASGHNVGSHSSPELGKVIFEALYSVFSERGIYLAAQCCEHLNRCVIIVREAAAGYDIVNAVPVPKAGGSFAAAAYAAFADPVAIEEIRADAGLDIGGTLIGMHLKRVAVPVRLKVRRIGEANVTAARTRPKLIGGARAVYDDRLG